MGLLILWFVLFFSIVAHEYGHYLGYSRAGVKPNNITIGFGVKILSFRYKDVPVTIGLIPLSAGVDVDPRNVPNVSEKIKAIVMGPLFNIIIALSGFLSILYYLKHIPTNLLQEDNILYLESLFDALLFIGAFNFTAIETVFFLIFINIAIAILNLLPVPPLDGYKLLNLILQKYTGWSFPERVESIGEKITYFLLFMLPILLSLQ